MALILEQESNYKYFCKICKKGFMCGRALGGHMRAHGIGDESMHIDDDDDDPASDDDWEDNVAPTNKRMYALRTNPNRLKSCRACKNCGKEFMSWKSFLEHGKCTSEDGESLVSPASGGGDNNNGNDNDNDLGGRGNYVWSKRKRSFRANVGNFNNTYNCPTREEEDLANCLMMLSNAKVDPLVSEPEESCASASKDEERRNPMNFISPLMQYRAPTPIDNKAKGVVANKGLFECKACKKVFNSHQALGGHRASHKKVKGCFAARQDYLDDNLADEDVITNDEEDLFLAKTNNNNNPTLKFDNNNATFLASSSKRKSKVHECTICHRVFSSGQALGGHKRCHWITANAPDTSTLSRFQQFHEHIDHATHQKPNFDSSDEPIDLNLDLNLPAPTEDYYLQSSFVGAKDKEKDINSQCQSLRYHEGEDKNNNNSNVLLHANANVDDEADSKVKLAKLSELKDMNKGGNSSHWLQVGIRSTTDVETNP
ncbi:hypothetical protein RIF29_29995 [Crotalaria pallida]|uniref:C2H2-type domain-containing protein n=1 Tax=Crotalaria pallida TaxID=3830 RepID=A0AAN9EFT1_CROPI